MQGCMWGTISFVIAHLWRARLSKRSQIALVDPTVKPSGIWERMFGNLFGGLKSNVALTAWSSTLGTQDSDLQLSWWRRSYVLKSRWCEVIRILWRRWEQMGIGMNFKVAVCNQDEKLIVNKPFLDFPGLWPSSSYIDEDWLVNGDEDQRQTLVTLHFSYNDQSMCAWMFCRSKRMDCLAWENRLFWWEKCPWLSSSKYYIFFWEQILWSLDMILSCMIARRTHYCSS